jgi:hypothetical protein
MMSSPRAGDGSGPRPLSTAQTWTKPPATGTLSADSAVDMAGGESAARLPLLLVKPTFSTGGDALNEAEPAPQQPLVVAAASHRGSEDVGEGKPQPLTAATGAPVAAAGQRPPSIAADVSEPPPPLAAAAAAASRSTAVCEEESEPPPPPTIATAAISWDESELHLQPAAASATTAATKRPLEDAVWPAPPPPPESRLTAVPAPATAGDFEVDEFMREHQRLFRGGNGSG